MKGQEGLWEYIKQLGNPEKEGGEKHTQNCEQLKVKKSLLSPQISLEERLRRRPEFSLILAKFTLTFLAEHVR